MVVQRLGNSILNEKFVMYFDYQLLLFYDYQLTAVIYEQIYYF
jgi:hypothetical protein